MAPVFDTIFTGTNVASAIYVAGQDDAQNKEGAVIWAWAWQVCGWRPRSTAIRRGDRECEEAMAGGGGYSYPPPRGAPPPARRARGAAATAGRSVASCGSATC